MTTITTAKPWILPLTWYYIDDGASNGACRMKTFLNNSTTNTFAKLAFMDLKMRFKITPDNISRASQLRFMIVYDKLPQREMPLWVQPNVDNTTVDDDVKGLFLRNTIDSIRHPGSHRRFRVLYDKTKTLNPYIRPYGYFSFNTKKAYKLLRSLETNAYDPEVSVNNSVNLDNNATDEVNYDTTNDVALGCPLTRGSIYLMVYSDGVTFTLDNNDSGLGNSEFSFNYRLGVYDT